MPHYENRVLALCSDADLALLTPHLEEVELPNRQVLEEPLAPIDYVYFPAAGIGSVIAISPEQRQIEVALFGRDGMTGSTLLSGAESTSLRTFIQVPGHGHRIPADAFRSAIGASPSLRELLQRFAEARTLQIAYTALSNGRHTLEERLARWILMVHDRVEGDEIVLTHEFLSIMLGVRRAGVTTALHILEGAQMIRATRGLVTVRDRDRLEEVAGDSYGAAEADYERIMGVPVRRTGRERKMMSAVPGDQQPPG